MYSLQSVPAIENDLLFGLEMLTSAVKASVKYTLDYWMTEYKSVKLSLTYQ